MVVVMHYYQGLKWDWGMGCLMTFKLHRHDFTGHDAFEIWALEFGWTNYCCCEFFSHGRKERNWRLRAFKMKMKMKMKMKTKTNRRHLFSGQ